MKIHIVGGGGFGRELLSYLQSDIRAGLMSNHIIEGFWDSNPCCELASISNSVTYLGDLSNYIPMECDRVIIAIGDANARKNIHDMLKEKGATIYTYIHRTAIVSDDAVIGDGCVICPFTIINAGSLVGENSVLNVFCSVGHGATIGAGTVLSPYCSLSGGSSIGNSSFMGSRATLFPNVHIGQDCVVDAHTAVRRSEADGSLISSRGIYKVTVNRFHKR